MILPIPVLERNWVRKVLNLKKEKVYLIHISHFDFWDMYIPISNLNMTDLLLLYSLRQIGLALFKFYKEWELSKDYIRGCLDVVIIA